MMLYRLHNAQCRTTQPKKERKRVSVRVILALSKGDVMQTYSTKLNVYEQFTYDNKMTCAEIRNGFCCCSLFPHS